MKKYFLVFFSLFAYFFLLIANVYAQSTSSAKPQPTRKTEESIIDKEINNLKDKIASKVAELRLVEKRGIIGGVKETTNTQISLSDIAGNTRFVDVDELTKFASPSAKSSFGISDLAKGTTVGVLGLYNKQSRRTLARFINVLYLPQVVIGHSVRIDSENFVIYVSTPNQEEVAVDIEATTKTHNYTKADGQQRSGFSKIKENQKIYVIGFPNKTEKNRVTADRIIVFPDLPANPKINVNIPTAEPTLKATPTPTPRTGKTAPQTASPTP